MNFLLDTCVVSELIKNKPEIKVANWIDSIEESRLFLSVITIGELEKGLAKLPSSKRKEKIKKWLDEDLIYRFDNRILNLDIDTFKIWGQLMATLENSGKKMPSIDSLIASIAIQNNLLLVTRNVKDFQNCKLELLNPWGV